MNACRDRLQKRPGRRRRTWRQLALVTDALALLLALSAVLVWYFVGIMAGR